MESFDVQAFTYQQRYGLLPELAGAIGRCGGWVLDSKALSSTNMEFQVEIQLRAVVDLYAAILSTGVELTRFGHEAFRGLCTRRKHRRITADLGGIVAIRLEIAFLDDITLHSLRCTHAGFA